MEITITAPLSLDIGIYSKMKTKQQIEIWSTSPQRKERQGRKKDRQEIKRQREKQRKRMVVKEKFEEVNIVKLTRNK
jgi:predicted Fe-S protein YdhL (DUF1289 family)